MNQKPDERDVTALPTSAFDYELPEGRIARSPAQQRDQSRLLVLHRETNNIEHRVFRDIAELIDEGDALVLNETRVLPARLLGKRAGGGAGEVLLLRPLADEHTWEALVRPGRNLKPGRTLEISPELKVEIVDHAPEGARIVRLHSSMPVRAALEQFGHMPLPPYIDRPDEAADRERYQTVFGRIEGSVAAPTAGLHFTEDLLTRLHDKGVEIVRILLHVGVGTFRPVDVEDPEQHVMHAEQYEVSAAAAEALNRTRESGGKIWAVGTTVTRTLESTIAADGTIAAGAGSTRLFIRPGYQFRAIDRLITNFHLPRSTLLMLVAAFAGYERTMHAYRVAIDQGYRFYSYGDAMVIV